MTINAYDTVPDLLGDLYIASGTAARTQAATEPALPELAITQRSEIVFIEDNVADIDMLVKGIGPGKEIVILDASRDGLQQIVQALAGRTNIDALHIVSHGAAGSLNLGALTLDAATLNAHEPELQAIGQSLRAGGDILLYGCDVGAQQGGVDGAGFVDRLAIATGADVAASLDPTGSADLGGDWNLEVSAGRVDTPGLVDAQLAATYRHVLGLTNPSVLDFQNDANFASRPTSVYDGPNGDVVYRVGGNANYQLRIDASATSLAAYSFPVSAGRPSGTYVNVAGQPGAGTETKVSLYFDTGRVFTLSSVQITNFQSSQTLPQDSEAQNLKFTAYAADTHVIGTATPYLPSQTGFLTVDLSNLHDIAKLTITTTDNGGILKFFALDNLSFSDIHDPSAPPAVTKVTSNPSSGSYTSGKDILIDVHFDSAVTVTGTPRLQLETGTTDEYANYLQGSGTSTLTFKYTVQGGDTSGDLDYLSTGALSLNGGTMKGTANSVNATLVLPTPGSTNSLGGNSAVVIDTIAPNAPSVPDLASASDTGTSNTDNITSNTAPIFNGTYSSGDVVTVKLYDGATEVGSHTVTGGTYSIGLSSALSEGSHTIKASAIDAAGNVSALSAGLTVVVDTTAPTVSVTSSSGASTLKAGDTSTVTFTFSEDPGTTFALADVSVSGGTLGAIAGTGTTRTATFTPTANTDNGTASVGVTASSYTDAAGNAGGAGAAVHIGYDTKAPTLSISPNVPFLKAGETATITFSFSDDPGAGFTWDGSTGSVAVSGGTLSALTGTGTTRTAVFTPAANTDNGTASITVTGVHYADAAGNTGADASLSFNYDTQAPNAPSMGGLDSVSDTGVSNTDGVTKETHPSFSGTAEAGAAVKLYDTNGTTVIGSGTADAGGIWHIATSATLAGGAHTVTAKAVDTAGNASTASAGATVMVDTAAPTLSITSSAANLKAGDTATITFTFSEDPGTSFSWDGSAGSVAVSGGTLSPIAGSGTVRTATFTPDAATNGGTASITVAAGTYSDAAGNDGAAGTTPAVHFDTLAPNAPSAPDLAGSDDTGTSASDDLTNAASTTFTGTAEAGATVRLYDGATEVGNATAAGGNYSITLSGPSGLAEGGHTLTAVAFDAAGNASAASGALTVNVDRTAPATTVTSATLAQDTGASATDFITSVGTSQTVSGLLGANLAAGEQVMVSTDNGATWHAAAATVGQNTWSLATNLAGSDTLKVHVVDAAGNAGSAYVHAYTVDQVPPSAPSTPDLSAASDSGVSATDDITNVTQPVFTGTAETGATVTLYDTNGTTVLGSATAGAGGAWSITSSPLAAGAHTVTAKTTDVAGNTGAASSGLTLQVVTGGPATTVASVALSNDTGVSATDFVTNAAAQTISGTLGAALAAGQRVQVSLDGGNTWNDATAANGASTWSYAGTLVAGNHDIRARVADVAGNAGATYTQAYTLDTAAPTLSIAIGGGNAAVAVGDSTTVTFTFSEDPGTSFAWDGSSGDVTVTGGSLSALSGSGAVRTATFTPAAGAVGGTATIAVGAGSYTDLAGNAAAAGATFSVHVDPAPPPPPPGNVVDGVLVHDYPSVLPGGVVGTTVSVPVVTPGRQETSGSAGVADIPLATNGTNNLLTAQLAPGYGLTATGANAPAAKAGDLLLAAIGTAGQGLPDLAHLTNGGETFLAGLGTNASLLVETVKPVSIAGTNGVLTLFGSAPGAGHETALVIDASSLAPGSTIALDHLEFAAVIGTANVVVHGSGTLLAADSASQHITVAGGGPATVFTGGGADVLDFTPAPRPANGGASSPTQPATLLHGGAENDTATFAGSRDDYDVAFHHGYVVVTSRTDPNVQAVVVNVEQLQFGDTKIAVQDSADMDTLSGMYQSVFGRQADMKGIEFWADARAAGVSWGSIALSFIDSTEHTAGHDGFTGNVEHDVALLYTALFNRAPDAGGLAFWSTALRQGASLEQIATGFVESAEMTGHQRAATDWDFSV